MFLLVRLPLCTLVTGWEGITTVSAFSLSLSSSILFAVLRVGLLDIIIYHILTRI
jgi:hypothetical protein